MAILRLAQLLAGLPDNIVKSILPVNIRNIPDSFTVFGELKSDATSNPFNTTPTKFIGFNGISTLVKGVTPEILNNKIIIDKPGDFIVHMDANIEADQNTFYYFEIRKNGLNIIQWQRMFLDTSNDTGIFSMTRHIELIGTDEIEVWIYSSTGSGTITINSMNLSVKRLLT